MMVYNLKRMWADVVGMPSAPLIREQLTTIDLDLMRTKTTLIKELPVLTLEDLTEEPKKHIQEEVIIGQLMIAGFEVAANEIRQIVKEDAEERQGVRANGACNPRRIPLDNDVEALQTLASCFSASESLVSSKQWIELIIARLELAEDFGKKGDLWLAEAVVKSCFGYLDRLLESSPENRIVLAEVNLTIAFLLYNRKNASTGNDLAEIKQYLDKCIQLSSDRKNRYFLKTKAGNKKDAMKREGVIQLLMERPIALHGWRGFKNFANVHETITLTNTSLYKTACILYNLVLLQDLRQRRAEHKSLSSHQTLSVKQNALDKDFNEVADKAFLEAIVYALEGTNTSNVFHVLYAYGQYFLERGNIKKSNEIFHQLHTKSMMVDDFETLGVTYNFLALICKREHYAATAASYLVEEWDLGCQNDLPVLQIDALLDLGMILLEEGDFQAEEVYWHAFYRMKELCTQSEEVTKPESNNIKFKLSNPDMRENEKFQRSWAMTGVAAGQAIWPKVSTYLRSKEIQPILAWKTNRRLLPPTRKISYRVAKINKTKSDSHFLSQTVSGSLFGDNDDDDDLDMELQEWEEEVYDENYQFQCDIGRDRGQLEEEEDETTEEDEIEDEMEEKESGEETEQETDSVQSDFGIHAEIQHIFSAQVMLISETDLFKRDKAVAMSVEEASWNSEEEDLEKLDTENIKKKDRTTQIMGTSTNQVENQSTSSSSPNMPKEKSTTQQEEYSASAVESSLADNESKASVAQSEITVQENSSNFLLPSENELSTEEESSIFQLFPRVWK